MKSESQSCLTLCDPMDCTVHGILQAKILEWVAVPFSRDRPNPGIEPRSPALQADSLLVEPFGKFQNAGVGSLSLPHQIFLTQESKQGLACCRQILRPLTYKGDPVCTVLVTQLCPAVCNPIAPLSEEFPKWLNQ